MLVKFIEYVDVLVVVVVVVVVVKPPPPIGAGGGYMFSGRPSVPLSVCNGQVGM